MIKENEFAAVKNGKILPREQLLDAAETAAVAPNKFGADFRRVGRYFSLAETRIEFRTANYPLQVSNSPFFVPDAMVIERDSITNQIFTFGQYRAGNILLAIARRMLHQVKRANGENRGNLRLSKRTNSEAVTAGEWQVEKVGGNIYIISGKTNPGATVRSSGREIFASGDGSFRLQISASTGAAAVEISDESGQPQPLQFISKRTSRAVRLIIGFQIQG